MFQMQKNYVDWQRYATDHDLLPNETWETVLKQLKENGNFNINAEFEDYLTEDGKKAVLNEYAPEYVNLYYVDYDNLDNHKDLLEQCVQKNSLYPLSEAVYDWWDFPESEYLREIESKMEADGFQNLYYELQDNFTDIIDNKDTSDPVQDLLENTGKQVFFYSLGVEIGSQSSAVSYKEVRSALDVKEGTDADMQIRELVDNALYGGELRVYFEAELQDLIACGAYDESSDDFHSVHVKGKVCVGILDSYNGSAYYEVIDGVDIEVPFDRDNLHLSQAEKYSMEEICGLITHWVECEGGETPQFNIKASDGRKTIKKSTVNQKMSLEAEYAKTFRNGGCTTGDMDIHRHRDIQYINSFPCGSRCPHCGTFWVD